VSLASDAGRVFLRRLEADEKRGGGVGACLEVLLHRLARLLGDDHGALAIAFADHSHAVWLPVTAVEAQRLGDAGAGRQQEQDEGAVAFLLERLGGERVEQQITRVVVQGLGKPLRQLRDVDRLPQAAGEPFFPGGEAQEAPQRDQSACARGDRQLPPRAPGACLQAGQVALVGTQQLTVEPGDAGQAVVAPGEVREAGQVGLVLGDGARGGAAVLATSLYDNPAAELHEDASARLRKHLALPGCSMLRRSSPSSGVSGYQDPTGAPRGGAVANHRERPVSRDTVLRICCRTPTMRQRGCAASGEADDPDLPVLCSLGVAVASSGRAGRPLGTCLQVRQPAGPPGAGWYRHSAPVRIEDCRCVPAIGAATVMRSMAARMVRVTLTRARSASAVARRERPARPVARRSSPTSTWRSVRARSAAARFPARSAAASSLSSSRIRRR